MNTQTTTPVKARPLFPGEWRYGIHKEGKWYIEVFMLFPKNRDDIQYILENLKQLTPLPENIKNRMISKEPFIGAMFKSCESSEIKTYAEPGCFLYRNSPYFYHLYQFVNNNFSKIEITSTFDPQKRSKEAVKKEIHTILEQVTSGVPFVPCYEHCI